jgi:hypothetical protein
MSKIRDLRTSPEHTVNLVDILELFSPEKKSKYTEMLLRLMKGTKNLNSHAKEIISELTREFDFVTSDELSKYTPIQLMIIHQFLTSFFNFSDLQNYRKFCDYNERNLINQNDLTKYKSFDEVITQLNLAELKVESKNMENEVVKVYDDHEWLLLRPLTYLSSKKYGANTKWCTTSEGSSQYFDKYSKKGVLIYCINKLTGYKVASFYSLDKSDKEFSFWNQKDDRIDSLDSELTDELRLLIGKLSKDKFAVSNNDLLSTEQRRKEENTNKKLSSLYLTGEAMNDEPEPLRDWTEPEVDVTEEPITEQSLGTAPYLANNILRRNEERIRRERVIGVPTDTNEQATENRTESVSDIISRMRLTSGDAEGPSGFLDNRE